jgi:TfoX/Sxy family transcriptional regulator of competence genes
MEKPTAVTTAWFTDAIPEDPRAVKGKMFGHPCAFVNGNMFFGTFGQSVIVRVGEERATALTGAGTGRIFAPMEGRLWKEYVQLDLGTMDDTGLARLAKAALEHTAKMPAKPKKGAKAKRPA